MKTFNETYEEFFKFKHSEETLKILNPLSENKKPLTDGTNEALQLLERHDANSDALAKDIIFNKVIIASQKISSALNEADELGDQHTTEFIKASDLSSRRLKIVSFTVSIAAALLLALFGFFFSSWISSKLMKTAQALSQGAEQVASATSQLSATSESLSSGAIEQSAALQETASSIEELSAMVKKNAENAKQSSEIAQQSRDSANEGVNVVQEVITAITEISNSNTEIMTQIESSNRDISEIVKLIEEIGEKTKVINEIVFQTKLLSFNASVEAARAGEHGKGFAVVAEEVGNLAQMSGNAAREITLMLDASVTKVNSIVGNTKRRVEQLILTGKSKVETGVIVARRCGDTLQELAEKVGGVNQMMNEISIASSEQAHGIQEITKAMHQLDEVTQTNTSASQDSASAANSLSKQAELLHSNIEELLLIVEGAKPAFKSTFQATAVSSLS